MLFKTVRHTLELGVRTHIMGILNVTPDSFSDGGSFAVPERALEHALKMVEYGADIIDIGGESSKPGSARVTEKEELARVLPVIKALAHKISVPISIDTYKPSVAEAALREGVEIVNDISAFTAYPEMVEVVAKYNGGAVLMHMQGCPSDMQKNPQYSDVVGEISSFLSKRAAFAMKNGVARNSIMIDPGIGFGKTALHNLSIIKNLAHLKDIGLPILIGTSRKAFIGKILSALPPSERLEGTIASVCAGVMNGARVVRVHDVRAVKKALLVMDAITNCSCH